VFPEAGADLEAEEGVYQEKEETGQDPGVDLEDLGPDPGQDQDQDQEAGEVIDQEADLPEEAGLQRDLDSMLEKTTFHGLA